MIGFQLFLYGLVWLAQNSVSFTLECCVLGCLYFANSTGQPRTTYLKNGGLISSESLPSDRACEIRRETNGGNYDGFS